MPVTAQLVVPVTNPVSPVAYSQQKEFPFAKIINLSEKGTKLVESPLVEWPTILRRQHPALIRMRWNPGSWLFHKKKLIHFIIASVFFVKIQYQIVYLNILRLVAAHRIFGDHLE